VAITRSVQPISRPSTASTPAAWTRPRPRISVIPASVRLRAAAASSRCSLIRSRRSTASAYVGLPATTCRSALCSIALLGMQAT
jgi:hypothetical protein